MQTRSTPVSLYTTVVMFLYLGRSPESLSLPSRNLPDDPKAEWKVSLVSSVIVKHMRAHSFNMVR